jgi:hypothetical protein
MTVSPLAAIRYVHLEKSAREGRAKPAKRRARVLGGVVRACGA